MQAKSAHFFFFIFFFNKFRPKLNQAIQLLILNSKQNVDKVILIIAKSDKWHNSVNILHGFQSTVTLRKQAYSNI